MTEIIYEYLNLLTEPVDEYVHKSQMLGITLWICVFLKISALWIRKAVYSDN